MKKTTRFVIWICSKFTRSEIEQIIQGLIEVLAHRNLEILPKDDFKDRHPNYRNFLVDPKAPLKTPPKLMYQVRVLDFLFLKLGLQILGVRCTRYNKP